MRLRTSTVAAALALTLAFGAIAYATIVAGRGSQRTAPTFRIKGKVRDLYPGVRTVLSAKVVNRFDRAIVVRRVTAKVTSPTPTCPSSAIRVKAWRGKLSINAHRSKRVPLNVRMKPTSPDGCQGVRFQIRYGGKAVRR